MDISKLMIIQGEIKIKLILEGMSQEKAHNLAAEITQMFIDLFIDYLENLKT